MQIHAACHCRNIRFTLDWPDEPPSIPARQCTCTFCLKHGGVWTATPAGRLRVQVQDPDRVSHYAFGTRTADFHVCAVCGAVPVVTSEIDGRRYAVVNVNCFEDVDPARLQRVEVSFDGEAEDARLARRARNWIGDVQFESPG